MLFEYVRIRVRKDETHEGYDAILQISKTETAVRSVLTRRNEARSL